MFFFLILIDESQSQSTEPESGSENFNLTSLEKITGRALVMQHFLALYVKRYCNSKRNLKGFACEVTNPKSRNL
jgi:ATP-binding cassette subfamily A (ABC1) protein 1